MNYARRRNERVETMKRRQVLKWTTPVVAAVVLPAHAATSEVVVTIVTTEPPTTKPPVTLPPTTQPPVTTLPPVTTQPPSACHPDEVLICHNPTKHRITKCVPSEALKGHLGHGDYIGACDE